MATQQRAISQLATASAVFLIAPCLALARPDAGEQDLSNATQAVVQLLKTADAARFAKALAPTLQDWRGAVSTNELVPGKERLGADFQKRLDQQRDKVEDSAKRLLAKAAELKLDFFGANITAKSKPPSQGGRVHYGDVQAEGETLPFAPSFEIVLTVESSGPGQKSEIVPGEYTLALQDLIHFTNGWRSTEGVRWVALPPGVVNEKTRCELAIMTRATAYQGLTQIEDPALIQIGERLVEFVRNPDPKIVQPEPSDEDNQREIAQSARRVIALMQQSGVSFEGGTIQLKKVSFDSLFARAGVGQIDGVEGNLLRVSFAVESARKSKTGKSLSGEYGLLAEGAVRKADQWHLTGPIQWSQFPEGVLNEDSMAELKLENYVAEHETLPPGTAAPGIRFVRMDNEQSMSLEDLRGKVVVLDFWAVSCGPCQEPLHKMQKYFEDHPDWKGRVEIVPLSIDNTLKEARNHLTRRGWTNTFNVWAGPEGWESAPARAFRIKGIPTCYIIDTSGTIVEAGHLIDPPEIVDRLLK